MIDRIPTPLVAAPALRLHAWYRSAGALLRELSRALNQGRSILRADSGLPAGSTLVLVMSAECLSAPIEIRGTVTSWRVRGRHHEMTLRYDLDPKRQRARLAEALGELRRETRRPRAATRVPLTISAEAASLARGLDATLSDASRTGARLRIAGRRLPEIQVGSRIAMRIQGRRPGARRPLRVALEVRWRGPVRQSHGGLTREVGGRFVGLTDRLQKRLRAILRFEEPRPRLSLRAIEPPPAATAGRPGRVSRKHR